MKTWEQAMEDAWFEIMCIQSGERQGKRALCMIEWARERRLGGPKTIEDVTPRIKAVVAERDAAAATAKKKTPAKKTPAKTAKDI